MIFPALWRLLLSLMLVSAGMSLSLDPMPALYSLGHWISWILFNGIEFFLYILLNGLGCYWCIAAVHLAIRRLRSRNELALLPRFSMWRFTTLCTSIIFLGGILFLYFINVLQLSPLLSGIVAALYFFREVNRRRKTAKKRNIYETKEVSHSRWGQDKVHK